MDEEKKNQTKIKFHVFDAKLNMWACRPWTNQPTTITCFLDAVFFLHTIPPKNVIGLTDNGLLLTNGIRVARRTDSSILFLPAFIPFWKKKYFQIAHTHNTSYKSNVFQLNIFDSWILLCISFNFSNEFKIIWNFLTSLLLS